jgi:hypothetical protein
MKKKKAAKRKADVQDLLLKAGTLADNAITSAKKNEQNAGRSHTISEHDT